MQQNVALTRKNRFYVFFKKKNNQLSKISQEKVSLHQNVFRPVLVELAMNQSVNIAITAGIYSQQLDFSNTEVEGDQSRRCGALSW